MTEDQGKGNTPSDRLEEIKREEKEDASSYYAQGDTKDNVNDEAEFVYRVHPEVVCPSKRLQPGRRGRTPD